MKNAEQWLQTKFERTCEGRWRACRTTVPKSSRIIADRIAQTYADAIQTHATGRLADLGCGKVPLYGMYRDQTSSVYCVDWPSGLHGADHVDLFADLNVPLTLQPEGFDTVLASDVIEHLHTPQNLLDSSARALKPGGKLILGVPFLYWVHEAPHDYHRYTRFALERMCTLAGLRPIELQSYGGAPEVIADLATKAVAGRPAILSVIYGTAKLLLALPIVQKLSTSTKETIPMGYLLVATKV